MEKLTRNQAIERVGEKAVIDVEAKNCEPTGRLQSCWDDTIEYMASVICKEDGYDVCLDVYYYPEKKSFIDSDGEPIEDLGNINWQIAHYEIQ